MAEVVHLINNVSIYRKYENIISQSHFTL